MKFRHIDTHVFESLVRPQYPTSCGISSLTTGLKYLINPKITQENVAKILNLDITSNRFNPGNETIGKWSKKAAEHLGIKLKYKVLFEEGWKYNSEENDKYWETIKKAILDKNKFLILHIDGHYAPILGFASYPDDPSSKIQDSNRWILVADPSPYHDGTLIENIHWNISPPIWSVRWGVVREELKKVKHYGIIQLQAKCRV